MEAKRAREIAASPVMVNVTFNGAPIYIENIMADNTTAYVHQLDKPNFRQQVSIAALKEQ